MTVWLKYHNLIFAHRARVRGSKMGMKPSTPYSGYLAAYVELIRALHEDGATTGAIAEALYAAGARARTSDPRSGRLSRKQHLVNLRAMIIHVQRRLGLRIRHVRILNLAAGA